MVTRTQEPTVEAAASRWWGHPIREYGWPLELASLRASSVWDAADIPSGEGRPVMLIPGFLAGDSSLATLGDWLRRRDYRVGFSGIRWNVGCADRILGGLAERVERLSTDSGGPVQIVGHSRGGLLGFALAGLRPDLVSRLITLGSPLVDNFDIAVPTGVAVAGARYLEYALHPESRERGCFTADCSCPFAEATQAQSGLTVPVTCVVTPDDGVVSPAACVLPGADVYQVRGTHIGLAFNKDVYRILGDVLAS